jgi:hypothetical protein
MRTRYTAALLVAALAACNRRIPEPVGGPSAPRQPQVGWVIMTGDAENPDREFVCQSNPRSDCVLQADRPQARSVAHVYFYYHGTTTETRYTGPITIGFFDPPHDLNPNVTVKPGESAANQSVSDFVSTTPGGYAMTIGVTATAVSTGQPQDLGTRIEVNVK